MPTSRPPRSARAFGLDAGHDQAAGVRDRDLNRRIKAGLGSAESQVPAQGIVSEIARRSPAVRVIVRGRERDVFERLFGRSPGIAVGGTGVVELRAGPLGRRRGQGRFVFDRRVDPGGRANVQVRTGNVDPSARHVDVDTRRAGGWLWRKAVPFGLRERAEPEARPPEASGPLGTTTRFKGSPTLATSIKRLQRSPGPPTGLAIHLQDDHVARRQKARTRKLDCRA